MKSLLSWLLLGCLATTLRAELPTSVLEACLAPKLFDHTTSQVWEVTNRARFEGGDVTISEFAGAFSATQAGKPHPNEWGTTQVTLRSPVVSAANPTPRQTFEVAFTAGQVVPQMTIDFILIDNAALPPYEVKAWGNYPALVSKAGDWYVIACNPKATITLTQETPQRTTVAVKGITVSKGSSAREAFWIGEGPLPAPPVDTTKD